VKHAHPDFPTRSASTGTPVKWCGALYLAYAGIRLIAGSLRKKRRGDAPAMARAAGTAAILREGFVINVFNPKVALFFLAFLPQFIDPQAPSKTVAFLLLGCVFNVNSLLVNLPVAWLASRAAQRVRSRMRAARVLQGALGALFVALAARLAATQRP
jgi:threonine/homoserine/homoserine lactone efflux protein